MRTRYSAAMLTVYGAALSLFIMSFVAGCSHSTTLATNPPQPTGTTPTVAYTPTTPPAQTVDINSFPVWAQNEYKAEAYLGKSKEAMVSAIGPPASVEGGADDHSDISNKRLAYIYAGNPGPAPQNTMNCQVQVYFGNNDVPDTVVVLTPNPTLGDVFDYLCGPGATPTDIYCPSDPNTSGMSYVYGKTRQGHRFVVTLSDGQNTSLVNYPKTFNVNANQYIAGSPTFNVTTWRQSVPYECCVVKDAIYGGPGRTLYVSRWFGISQDNFKGQVHVKIN